MRGFYLFLLTTGIFLHSLNAQVSQPFFHHFTAEDGLPSSEVYYVMQDSEGFMWFGTDNGVARFDGYEFKVYGIADGLTDVVAFTILEDHNHRIWVSTFSGRIFYLEGDQFMPYQYNDQVVQIRSKEVTTKLIDVRSSGEMVLLLNNDEVLKIDSNGRTSHLFTTTEGVINIHRRVDKYGNVEQYSTAPAKTASRNETLKNLKVISHNSEGVDTTEFVYFWDSPSSSADAGFIAPNLFGLTELDNRGQREMLAVFEGQFVYTDTCKNTYSLDYTTDAGNTILPHHDNGFWVAMDMGEGLLHASLKQDSGSGETYLQLDNCLNGHSASYLRYDRSGGLWVCTRDAGVFYSSNPRQNTFNDPTGQNSIPLSLQLLDEHSYLAGYDNRKVVHHDVAKNTHHAFKLPGTFVLNMYSLKYVPQTDKVYSSLGYFSLSDSVSKKVTDLNSFKKKLSYFRYLGYDPLVDDKYIYFVYSSDFGIIDVTTDKIVVTYHSPPDFIRQGQCFGQDHSGRLLLGTTEGLFEVQPDGTILANKLGFPELGGRIASINLLINGGTLIGTRGSGLVFYGNEGSRVINQSDGLASNIIRQVHQSADGNIWVATLSGLSKLVLDKSGNILELRSFQRQHGLPSNEIHYIHSLGNDVWLATGGGVVDFTTPNIETAPPKVSIRSISVDGHALSPDSLFFAAGQKDIKISFGTINYQMLGRIPYRYRIQDEQAWRYTTNRTVEYPNLPPGSYDFEIQSQNQEKDWSSSTLMSFKIPPLWYDRWQARVLGLILLILAIAGIFTYREKNRRRELAIQEQMDDLERSAVQAQMNPHFIFNSLNSIQYFILQNETKQAVYYLARFASLIRQTLRSSIAGVHTLKEEVNTLETYLSLEKLRFKERFNYRIEVDESLPREQIRLSPLLIQPYVENALIHGLAEIDEGGLIVISFTGTASELVVTVADNGIGFDPSTIASDSVGMSITKRRLELLTSRKLRRQDRIKIETTSDARGRTSGTVITLKITSR